MTHKMIGKCPVCNENMIITRLECPECKVAIEGKFELDKFSSLSPEQLKFIEVFIKSRGNIKEVEREMGISYPTVRNKLDEAISALGYNASESPDDTKGEKRKDILEKLEQGEIDSSKAIKMLENL